jgi:uncharacterized protein YegP (UPF0339 family)
MKFQIVMGKSPTQPYFWRVVDSSGKTIAVSENYVAKASAKAAIDWVIKNAGAATVEDLT